MLINVFCLLFAQSAAEYKIVFFIASGVYVFGIFVYAIFATGKVQQWSLRQTIVQVPPKT